MEISSGSDESVRFTWDSPLYPIILTQSQENLVQTCIKLLPAFKILVIKGESSSGKQVVAREVFERLDAVVEILDICYFAKNLDHEISNQDLIEYFGEMLGRLKRNMLLYNGNTGIIYIPYFNNIIDVLGDCNSKVRFMFPLILKYIIDTELMASNIRIVITTHGCLLPENIHWCVDLVTTRGDMEHVLVPYVEGGIISNIEYQGIMKISKVIPVGRMLFCLRYALAYTRDELRDETCLLESYRKALCRFSGSIIDIDKNIPNPVPEDDLVGVEHIIDEIMTSIINPMELNIPGISIKKGLLLCGPPGTGKTSIGRWLAHKIKGKFYLLNGDIGPNLIESFQIAVRRANENAPAVIFIDDADSLFDDDNTYRSFLMILDGIESNKRSDVCVVVTCMNMKRVPASLLRGGRLEMALVTRLPDHNKIQIILERALKKMQNVFLEHKPEVAIVLATYLERSKFIPDIALKMTGWNCADIKRCVNDVSRLIVSNKGTDLNLLFNKCIQEIRRQYELCGTCESTNLDYRPQDLYIS